MAKKPTAWHMSGTERGRYRFTAKERVDGACWLACEPIGGAPQIGFTLRPGTTLEQAHEVAQQMNDWIVDILLF
jgi:hypothetical protein